MNRIVRTVLLGGAVAAAMFATAAPASAACSNDPAEIIFHIPTVCVFYDNCDADICIGKP